MSHLVVLYSPSVSYMPQFAVKTCRPDAPLPRSFRICSLREFALDLGKGSLLCPVLSLHAYLECTKSAVSCASLLFISPRSPSHQISKSAQYSWCRHFDCFYAKLVSFLSCWRQHRGGRIQFLPLFICVMFSTLWKASVPLAPLWLRVLSFLRVLVCCSARANVLE